MAKRDFAEFDDLEPEGGTVQRNGHQPIGAYSPDSEDTKFLDDEFVNEGLEEDDLEVDYLDEFDDEDELYDELLDEFADFDEFDDGEWVDNEDEEEFAGGRRRLRRTAAQGPAARQPTRRNRTQHGNSPRKRIRPQQRSPQITAKTPPAANTPVEPAATGRQERNPTQLSPAAWLAKQAAKSADKATAVRLIIAATGSIVQADPLAKAQWILLPVLLQRTQHIVTLLHRRRQTRTLLAQWPQLMTQTLGTITRLITEGRTATPTLVATVLQRTVEREYKQLLRKTQRPLSRRRHNGMKGEYDQDAAEWWDDESDL